MPDSSTHGTPSSAADLPEGVLLRQDGDPDDTVLVLTSVPDALLAKRIAHVLVEESLVACAQAGSPVVSMYLWQGRLEGGEEIPMSFKTTARVLPDLYRRLCQLHPYDVPEFLVQGIAAGSAAYLQWVRQSTAQADASSTESC